MKIEIVNQEFEQISGTDRNGRPFNMRKQQAYASLEGQKYPTAIMITLGENQQPWPVGMYEVGGGSFYVDRYGQLALAKTLQLRALSSSSIVKSVSSS